MLPLTLAIEENSYLTAAGFNVRYLNAISLSLFASLLCLVLIYFRALASLVSLITLPACYASWSVASAVVQNLPVPLHSAHAW